MSVYGTSPAQLTRAHIGKQTHNNLPELCNACSNKPIGHKIRVESGFSISTGWEMPLYEMFRNFVHIRHLWELFRHCFSSVGRFVKESKC